MAEIGITAFGAYVPRLRISRAVIAQAHKWMAPSLMALATGSRAFTSWDEDAITMAVEAARDALGDAPPTGAALRLASTNLPYADLQNASIVASALGAPATISCADIGGSQSAGVGALLQAIKTPEASLVICSDAPIAKPASVQELSYGAGAAAFKIGSDGVIARLIGSASVNEVFVDHFRAAKARYDYFWEERWVREEGYGRIAPAAIRAALADAGLGIEAIQHFVMPSLLKGAAEAVARKVKFAGAIADGLEEGVGYAGAAHGPLMLTRVLEGAKPGERILFVGFGQGAIALVLEVTNLIRGPAGRGVTGAIGDAIDTDSYLRMLSFCDGIDLEWGMRSERSGKTALTEQYRSSDQLNAFVAGACGSCGVIQFPQMQYCVNCHAPSSGFSAVSLADKPAKVLTSTADWLSFHPAPPLYSGFVQFENGARLLMEMVDVGPSGVDTNTPLRMVFRIKEKDRVRGYARYFWKAKPIQV